MRACVRTCFFRFARNRKLCATQWTGSIRAVLCLCELGFLGLENLNPCFISSIKQGEIAQFLKHVLQTTKDKNFALISEHCVTTTVLWQVGFYICIQVDLTPNRVIRIVNPYVVVFKTIRSLASKNVHLSLDYDSSVSCSWRWTSFRSGFHILPGTAVNVETIKVVPKFTFFIKASKNIHFAIFSHHRSVLIDRNR